MPRKLGMTTTQYDIYLVHRSLVCLVYEMSSFNLICLFVIANNIQLKSALVKIGAQQTMKFVAQNPMPVTPDKY